MTCLGNFVDFSVVEKEETQDPATGGEEIKNDYFKIMMAAANKAKHLPQKKLPVNSKAKLTNDIIHSQYVPLWKDIAYFGIFYAVQNSLYLESHRPSSHCLFHLL